MFKVQISMLVLAVRVFAADADDVTEAALNAVSRGQADVLGSLLTEHPGLLKQTNFGKFNGTLLHFAAYDGNTNVMTLLLDRGIPVDARNHLRLTPLHIAAKEAPSNAVELLIRRGAQVEARWDGGYTPLREAQNGNNVGAAEVLLTHGARADFGVLSSVAWQDQFDFLRLLLARGVDPNLTNTYGYTALHQAVFYHRPKMVQLLIDAKANVNATTVRGETVLDWVGSADSSTNIPAILAILRDHGAISKKPKNGGAAAVIGDVATLRLMLAKYPAYYTNEASIHGETLLHIAAYGGSRPVAEFLITNGTPVQIRDDNGATPLHVAVEAGQTNLVPVLLKYGANPNARRKDGQTPLSLARATHRTDLIQLLETPPPKRP